MNSANKIILFIVLTISFVTYAQHSVARDWNEQLLFAIRNDVARPTSHARNLFHSSVVMYDAWAIFNDEAGTVLLGKKLGNYTSTFSGIQQPSDKQAAIHEVLSYAMFRLLNHRFSNSPLVNTSKKSFLDLFNLYGYDANFIATDYSTGSYAALGNYLAAEMIAFGLQDGSNEVSDYENQHYQPVNPPIQLNTYIEEIDIDPNHWQPLAFDVFIDQGGFVSNSNTPDFLGPEWGQVTPFCLTPDNLKVLNHNFNSYVYNDPGPPVYIKNSNENGIDDAYKWNFALVAAWSAHLDPNDPTLIDISPASIGNAAIDNFEDTFEGYKSFYDFINGGDSGKGHSLNPVTNLPYTPQLVKRSDYARVLAEFWADGPDSETPPGHWFTILNYVNDHPLLEKKMGGEGTTLDNLEWDVKSYLMLGGAMHDCAVNTWGIKGYYDYVRPISAIRYMASKGQSTDKSLPSYHPHGIPLIEGLTALIESGDALAGINNENVGKIKIYAWKGPDFINDPETDVAGVDWILGTHWWPYQRGTFVTPPFAGYVSGHSTFSRAAAEVLTKLTGNEYFPGGMGIFDIKQNDFLVFEKGPTQDMTLQWATYRDASDQTSLSRIWGGIHPPIDDIRGRKIGEKIGVEAFNLAQKYFNGEEINNNDNVKEWSLFPIPFTDEITLQQEKPDTFTIEIYN
ncbi:vanadium-dependent haloperoxidase [Aureibaculum sp. 2210JD6-5]|uniref:vanadium-dependent haloperoxidase n=1 Tax=Aureibaculum sp. 2210JD6-5 TaxID=3103957 RepID=UPI002AACA755|nr:vanadium-dependent haloperoxidase [Aureibaculum sp. 2210JD6-5]MDY7394041.1 vanadium-dependent haloperoxidase [Aureibaculum sp. 2210JD6-5]